MERIRTIADVVEAVQTDLTRLTASKRIDAQEIGDLVLLNYSKRAAFLKEWTPAEVLCRGLIINRRTGEIVARPFDKFFNWGEGGRTTDAPIVRISEKADGSLGVSRLDNGVMKISTRGSMQSWQAEWATQFLRERCDVSSVNPDYTLLFEIICPENRIVVDYGRREALVLLAARNRHTGEYVDIEEVRAIAHKCGFDRPRVYQPMSVEALIKQLEKLSVNEEGFVAEFADGQRFKFKGEAYLAIALVLQHLSHKHVVELMALGQEQTVREVVPAALLGQFDEWIREINFSLGMACGTVDSIWQVAPKGNRRTFAEFVLEADRQLAPCLFLRWDGKAWKEKIWQVLFGYRGEVSR